ncbi:MAG: hypothetical protein HOV70_20210 [Streptomyces sp.]|nr:hypothetical protein [Streptomyces sp.]
MTDQPRMLCGNDPRTQLTDGDRQAVAQFREYLDHRAALDRVRAVLETESVLGRSALDYRGLILAALMGAEAQPKAEAKFFQPGHTYTCLSDSAVQWTFKVAAVAESPAGDLAALGFLKGANFGTGVWMPHGELDFNGWTDAAAGQDGAQQA